MAEIIAKSDALYDVYGRKPGGDKTNTHYCAGCGHGIIQKLIAEALTDLGMTDNTVFISPVGCSVFSYYYFNCGNVEAPHGRAPAVGTGVTRVTPDNYVISYQGDGDLAAIGTAEIIHAANRGEKMTVFFVNNAIYGMTGGQMAPTSLIGQKTVTSPYGRSQENEGYPLRMAEMIATLEAPSYVERCSVHDVKHVMKTRISIRKVLQAQRDQKGFTFLEILSQCPSNWKVTPGQSEAWMKQYALPYFALGVFKDDIANREPRPEASARVPAEHIHAVLERGSTGKTVAAGEGAQKSLQLLTAGFGGQGVLLLAGMVAKVAMDHGYRITWMPSYGPEMRGGTANCSVVIDRDEIGSPMVENPDLLVAMNGPSLRKFVGAVADAGAVIYNASIVEGPDLPEGICVIPVKASDIASSCGNERAANTVILGVISRLYPWLRKEVFIDLLTDHFTRPEIRELNLKAFAAGRDVYEGNVVC